MKILLFSYLLVLAAVVSVLAQSQQVSIPLSPGESISNVFKNEEGLIIKKSNASEDIAVDFYDKELKKIYSTSLSAEKIKTDLLVSSPSGSHTYILDLNTSQSAFGKSQAAIVQIDREGNIQRKDFEKGKKFYLNAIFADDKHFYMLSSQKGDHLYRKDKLQEKLVLNRLDHNTLRYEEFLVDVPPIKSKDHSFWSLVQAVEDGFYVSSKTTEGPLQKIALLKIDSEGKVLVKNEITVDLSDKFPRPSSNFVKATNTYWVNSWDFAMVSKDNKLVEAAREGAFGRLYIDETNKHIYVFGLYGPKESFTTESARTTGFFVHKLNQSGGVIWKSHQDIPAPYQNSKYFYHLLSFNRKSTFTLENNGSSRLQIAVRDMLFNYELSPQGKLEKSDAQDFKAGWVAKEIGDVYIASQKNHLIATYLTNEGDLKKQHHKYQAYHFEKGCIVSRLEKNEFKLSLFGSINQ